MSVARKGVIFSVVPVVLLGWGLMKFLKVDPSAASTPMSLASEIKEIQVRRQDLRIVFNESGKLRAIKNVPIMLDIPGRQMPISWLAAEGSNVKKGDKLVEFGTKELDDQLKTTVTEIEKQKQQLQVAKSALEIAISTGKSNVSSAKTKLDEATVQLRTYRDLEGPKKINEMDSQINESRSKRATALKSVAEARRQLDEQIMTEDEQRKNLERELADTKETAETTKRILDGIILQKKIFRQYEYPHQYESKTQAVDNAKLELTKAQVSAEQEVNQKTIDMHAAEERLKTLQDDEKRFREQIAKCIITAPVDGMVIYGEADRGYFGDRENFRVGQMWYSGNVLMTIPDLSAFEVDIYVSEEYRGRVSEGIATIVTMEAIPGFSVKGKLKEISRFAGNREYYFSEGQRAFKTIVSLEKNDPRMVSGMSAKVEILADTAPNVLAVPVEALFNEGQEAICFVKDPDSHKGLVRRVVSVGKRNSKLVEIAAGLSEGETVSLVEPPNYVKPTTQPVKK